MTDDAEPEPRWADYPTAEAYRQAWLSWRAVRRDGRLNPAEYAAKWDAVDAALSGRRR